MWYAQGHLKYVRYLSRKIRRKESLGRPKSRPEDNIKINLKDAVYESVN